MQLLKKLFENHVFFRIIIVITLASEAFSAPYTIIANVERSVVVISGTNVKVYPPRVHVDCPPHMGFICRSQVNDHQVIINAFPGNFGEGDSGESVQNMEHSHTTEFSRPERMHKEHPTSKDYDDISTKDENNFSKEDVVVTTEQEEESRENLDSSKNNENHSYEFGSNNWKKSGENKETYGENELHISRNENESNEKQSDGNGNDNKQATEEGNAYPEDYNTNVKQNTEDKSEVLDSNDEIRSMIFSNENEKDSNEEGHISREEEKHNNEESMRSNENSQAKTDYEEGLRDNEETYNIISGDAEEENNLQNTYESKEIGETMSQKEVTEEEYDANSGLFNEETSTFGNNFDGSDKEFDEDYEYQNVNESNNDISASNPELTYFNGGDETSNELSKEGTTESQDINDDQEVTTPAMLLFGPWKEIKLPW